MMDAAEANVWERGDGLMINPGTCKFRGEGNSSLVVALRNKEQVLRLRKNSAQSEELGRSERLKRNVLQADFMARVMRKLLGPRIVQPPVLLPLTAKDVQIINESVENDRPAHRTKKRVPEVPTLGLVLPDHCVLPSRLQRYAEGPVLAVEIKPKQGFLPSSQFLPREHAIRASICRFHLTQNYKMNKGMISTVSRYCPLDLFSGCPERTFRALAELLCHPQNNLRVFKNRELVFGEEDAGRLDASLGDFFGGANPIGQEEQFCRLVSEILLRPFRVPEGEVSIMMPDVVPRSCLGSSPCFCRDDHTLPSGCVLERILRLQRLCSTDVTAIYPFYRDVVVALDSDDPLPRRYFGDGFPSSSLPKGVGKHEQQAFESDLEFACRKVWEFLVALTARDCSIMLSLQRLSSRAAAPPKSSLVQDACGGAYLFSVAVVDLDPKALGKLEKVYRDDCKMVSLVG